MKKILASLLGGLAVLVPVFGAGVASADNEYVGQTYEKAAGLISRRGGTPVIASRVGDYLPTDQCLVTGSRFMNFLDSSGNSRGGQVLLNINCNDTMTLGHPGYSAATPKGREAADLRDRALRLSNNYKSQTEAGEPPFCEANAERCVEICQLARTCSAELVAYLGL